MAACYRQRRIELVPSSARWTFSTGGGTGWTTVHRNEAGGLSLYQNGQRLELHAGLRLLGDAELEQRYWGLVDETKGAHRSYVVWRNVGFVMAGGGVAASLTGLGVLLADRDANVNLLVYGGAIVAVASFVPLLLAFTRYHGAIKHDRYREIFSERAYADRLQDSTTRFNEAIRRDCEQRISAGNSSGAEARTASP